MNDQFAPTGYVYRAVWLVLALYTLYSVVFNENPQWLVAFVAWCGGLMTISFFKGFGKTPPERRH